MKPFLTICLLVSLMLTACGPQGTSEAGLSLTPVPYAMAVPPEILPRLSTGPVDGPFGEEVRQAGVLGATTVYYSPLEQDDRVIFMTAYWLPEDRFDVLQKPDEPPLLGFEVLRRDGNVLTVAGPVDSIFAPDTPDGKNLIDLYCAIYLPETYRAEAR